MQLRWTAPEGLNRQEIVRVNGLPVRVWKVTEGSLAYKGEAFEVVYLSGISAAGPVKATLLKGHEVIAIS